jgi:hypothetical protein
MCSAGHGGRGVTRESFAALRIGWREPAVSAQGSRREGDAATRRLLVLVWGFPRASALCGTRIGQSGRRPSVHTVFGKEVYVARDQAALAAGVLSPCPAAPPSRAQIPESPDPDRAGPSVRVLTTREGAGNRSLSRSRHAPTAREKASVRPPGLSHTQWADFARAGVN